MVFWRSANIPRPIRGIMIESKTTQKILNFRCFNITITPQVSILQIFKYATIFFEYLLLGERRLQTYDRPIRRTFGKRCRTAGKLLEPKPTSHLLPPVSRAIPELIDTSMNSARTGPTGCAEVCQAMTRTRQIAHRTFHFGIQADSILTNGTAFGT
jgi:hypothetical protein